MIAIGTSWKSILVKAGIISVPVLIETVITILGLIVTTIGVQYALTEQLIKLIETLWGYANSVSVSDVLTNGISNLIAEWIFNN